MKKILALGIGGFIGSNLRYFITLKAHALFGNNFPYGTFAVNMLGCFILGFLAVFGSDVINLSTNTKLLLGTGMMGALTTFSTFSYETFSLMKQSNLKLAFISIALNLFIGLLAVWMGLELAKKLV